MLQFSKLELSMEGLRIRIHIENQKKKKKNHCQCCVQGSLSKLEYLQQLLFQISLILFIYLLLFK